MIPSLFGARRHLVSALSAVGLVAIAMVAMESEGAQATRPATLETATPAATDATVTSAVRGLAVIGPEAQSGMLETAERSDLAADMSVIGSPTAIPTTTPTLSSSVAVVSMQALAPTTVPQAQSRPSAPATGTRVSESSPRSGTVHGLLSTSSIAATPS